MWNAFSLSRYLLLLLVTAFVFVTVLPVLRPSHAIDLPIGHFYRPEERLKDLAQQGKAM